MNGANNRRRGDRSGFRFSDRRKSDRTKLQLVILVVGLGLVSTAFFLKIAAVRNEIETLAVQQAAMAAATASAINFAACRGGQSIVMCTAGITTCPGLTRLVTLPEGFTIVGAATLVATGDQATCSVTNTDTPPNSATFKAFGS
jgi:hypothetical protein